MTGFGAREREDEQFDLGHVNFEGAGYKFGSCWCIEVNEAIHLAEITLGERRVEREGSVGSSLKDLQHDGLVVEAGLKKLPVGKPEGEK